MCVPFRLLLQEDTPDVPPAERAEAVARLTQAARLRPSDPGPHAALGRALRAQGQAEEAMAALQAAVYLSPADLETANALGVTLLEAGYLASAAETFEAALAADPSRAPVHGNLGVAWWKLGRTDDALASLRRAVQLDPGSADLRRNLGLALAESGDRETALAAFRHAVRLGAGDPLCRVDLADALYAQGRHSEAAAEYEAALDLDASCLGARPASQQARGALALAAIREETGTSTRGGFRRAVVRGLLRAFEWTDRRARRRKGLDLAAALLVTTVAAFMGHALLRAWVRHHVFRDEVVRIAQLPTTNDAEVRAQLQRAVATSDLQPWLEHDRCVIRSAMRTRAIACEYVVPVELLPGLQRPLRFQVDVEEPFIAQRAPILF